MGQRERDRLKVLHEVKQGHLLQHQAAGQLGMSERGFRKLLKRFRERGDRGVIHGLRGRASGRRIPAGKATRVVKLVARDYTDFGPTLASEYLEREHGLKVSRESVRQLLMRAGRWKAKPRKLKQVHTWRQRRSCRGELLQWDTSIHAWLEERGPAKMYLIAGIDDATNALFARVVGVCGTPRASASDLYRQGRIVSAHAGAGMENRSSQPEDGNPAGTCVPGVGDGVDRGAFSTGQRARGTLFRHLAESPGEGLAQS
jgi:transposase